MRHAKSDWSRGISDHARGLNARGTRSASALGDWMRAKGYLPDAALVSDAARTRLTFEGLALLATPLTLLPELYHAEPDTLLAVLRRADAATVLIIAHNPGIASFAAEMVAAPPSHPDFMRYPTGATTVMDCEATAWSTVQHGAGMVRAFVTPRALTD